jgi:arylsulfatase A-like enzyme
MSISRLATAVALACVLVLTPPARAQQKGPNVLFILADDLGFADVSFNGRREWTTSNLHRLSQEGTVFRRFYTAGVVCAPARAALMTGKYGIHNGVTGNSSLDLPADEVTIAEALKPLGYATGMFGKWHHGGPRPGAQAYTHPMDQGFDEFFGFTNATAAHQKFPRKLFDGREEKESTGYADALFTDRAIDFMTRHKDEPFFCYVPYTAPHGRIEAPPEDVDRFKGKFPETDPKAAPNANYAAMLYRLDAEVGRLLATLDKLELARNTIVVFTSDHGATFEKLSAFAPVYFDSNRPFRGQKRTLWEGGMRVPTVIRWPGKIPSKSLNDEVMSMIDVFPTLLAACGGGGGEAEAGKVDGVNVLDVWRGKGKVAPRTLFWEWREGGDTQLAAMRGDMKFVITGDNQPEMFNVVTDPGERRTIDEEFPADAKQLRTDLEKWMSTETEAAKQRKKPATGKSSD